MQGALAALAIACAAGVCLSVGSRANAGFVGMNIRFDEAATIEARALGGALASAQVYRMYAVFDNAGNVVLNIFDANFGANNGSTLFNSGAPFGGDLAPNSGFFGFDPTLQFDTFVTIGEESNTGSTSVALDPDFAFSSNGVASGGWSNTNPNNLLGLSVQNGSVWETLVGQFTLESVTTSGFWVGDGGITFNSGIGTQTTQITTWGGSLVPPGDPTIVPYPTIVPPSPGAGAALALAGLAAGMRRRR